jgi:hypothetical protein
MLIVTVDMIVDSVRFMTTKSVIFLIRNRRNIYPRCIKDLDIICPIFKHNLEERFLYGTQIH